MPRANIIPSAVKVFRSWDELPKLTATHSYDFFANGRYTSATVQAGARRLLEALMLYPITVEGGLCIKSQLSKLRSIGFEIAPVMQFRADGTRYAVYVLNCWVTHSGNLSK